MFLHITLSNNIKNAGNAIITVNILIIAPLDISVHSEAIIPIFETTPTQMLLQKKHSPLTIIELIDVPNASDIASFLSFPSFLKFIYFVVINIA